MPVGPIIDKGGQGFNQSLAPLGGSRGAIYGAPKPQPFYLHPPGTQAASDTPPPLIDQTPTAPPLGSGSGGMRTAAPAPAAVAPPVVRPSLNDYINNNFTYKQQQAENDNALADYDNQTNLGRSDVQQVQEKRTQDLQRSLDDQGLSNAEDLAGRGLLRSGLNFQQQDKINASGADRRNGISDLLTQFEGQRGSGRVAQQGQNRAALNDRIAQLTQDFNTQNLAGIV